MNAGCYSVMKITNLLNNQMHITRVEKEQLRDGFLNYIIV